jgi:hypothetical protein
MFSCQRQCVCAHWRPMIIWHADLTHTHTQIKAGRFCYVSSRWCAAAQVCFIGHFWFGMFLLKCVCVVEQCYNSVCVWLVNNKLFFQETHGNQSSIFGHSYVPSERVKIFKQKQSYDQKRESKLIFMCCVECAVLICAVLICAVLICAVLICAVLICAVLICAVLICVCVVSVLILTSPLRVASLRRAFGLCFCFFLS